MDSKKNTILLTVIAIATLLVAVVGATFAYFTATTSEPGRAEVTVTTGSPASASFDLTNQFISIYADGSSFDEANVSVENGRSHTDTANGTVSWTAPGTASGSETSPSLADRTFCYTVKLDITTNTFVKSVANTTDAAELEFTAKKGETTIIDKMDITTTTTAVKVPTTVDGSTYTHQLVAEAGNTVTNSWEFTVTLVNLNVDQNDNTEKSFDGKIMFDKVACS